MDGWRFEIPDGEERTGIESGTEARNSPWNVY
jgi:hypothetical protein